MLPKVAPRPANLFIYIFGKMNSHKCKIAFKILQTNLEIGSIDFIGIMNQVHCKYNQFNLNFQPISLHVVYNFITCCEQFHELVSIFTTSQKSISWTM